MIIAAKNESYVNERTLLIAEAETHANQVVGTEKSEENNPKWNYAFATKMEELAKPLIEKYSKLTVLN